MSIRVAVTTLADPAAAIAELASDQGRGARFVALHASVGRDLDGLAAAAAAAFPDAALHGGTSCLGVMTGEGFARDAVGVFMLHDEDGDFATAAEPLGDDPREAARRATARALERIDRPGEAPDLIWLSVSPGREEAVIAGIEDAAGSHAPIVGGSVADDAIAGEWRVFGREGVMAEAVQVSVLFPSRSLGIAYQSGYAPTPTAGRASRVDGRRVYEIDGRPARDVYAEWTNGAVDARDAEAPKSILSDSTLAPLGREVGAVASVPFHLLAHPATANPDGSIDLFADVSEGEELRLMEGSADSLVARAGRVAARAAGDGAAPAGALMIYCGGCMLAVQDRMGEVAAGVDAALGGAPFLGVFTFGEQGAVLGEENRHGNLMISCVTFAA